LRLERADLQRDGLCAIPISVQADKILRFRSQAAIVERGDVSLPRHAPWLDEFLKELMQFPNGRHNDQVDSVSLPITPSGHIRDGDQRGEGAR
jgi:predicted phage terminase large subunit-like protein